MATLDLTFDPTLAPAHADQYGSALGAFFAAMNPRGILNWAERYGLPVTVTEDDAPATDGVLIRVTTTLALHEAKSRSPQLLADYAERAGQPFSVALDGVMLYGPEITFDTEAPADVTGLGITPGDTELVLDWTDPVDADFAGVMIRRALGAVPPADIGSGTLVDTIDPGVETFTDTGLTNDQEYSYTLFTFDEIPNYSAGESDSDTPVPPVVNLLVNGDFTTDVTGWVLGGGGTVSRVTDGTSWDGASLRALNDGNSHLIGDLTTPTDGYILTGKVRLNGGNLVTVYHAAGGCGGGAGFFGDSQQITVATEDTWYDFSITMPTEGASCSYIYIDKGGVTLYFDDLVLVAN